mgnify:CR=1 FL=1
MVIEQVHSSTVIGATSQITFASGPEIYREVLQLWPETRDVQLLNR